MINTKKNSNPCVECSQMKSYFRGLPGVSWIYYPSARSTYPLLWGQYSNCPPVVWSGVVHRGVVHNTHNKVRRPLVVIIRGLARRCIKY